MNATVNPLNVLNIRRVNFCSPHFSTVDVPKRYNLETSIVRWIENNCKGRFYLGPNSVLKDNSITTVYTIGFESHKELSYFLLACPYLEYNLN